MHREINCNILKTTKTYFPWKSKSGRNSWSSNIKIKIIKIYGNCEVMEEHTGNMILAVLRTSEWNFLYFYRNHCLRQTFAWIFFIISAPPPPWVESKEHYHAEVRQQNALIMWYKMYSFLMYLALPYETLIRGGTLKFNFHYIHKISRFVLCQIKMRL